MTLSRKAFVFACVGIFAVGLFMRAAWLRADPPVSDPVGIVWHDEGAWVHNARNRVLWGTWRTDDWNPVFVAPVFTALEYASFRTLGVGLWQARVVPVASGLVAIGALMAGLAALRGRRAAAMGGALLATNFAFVMWNRAALMESTMTAGLVVAWAAYAASERRTWYGFVAGAAAVAAWFTKASAAFFLAALVFDAGLSLVLPRLQPTTSRGPSRSAWLTLTGLALAGLIVVGLFVAPHWSEYRFYNWQMSVTRKPSYSLRDLEDRASWLPFVQSIFSHAWLVVAAAFASALLIVRRWWDARPAERLLVLWLVVGFLELIVHDSGNERRYVMFIPPLVALASLVLDDAGPAIGRAWSGARAVVTVLALPLGYVAMGSLIRPFWLTDIEAGHMHVPVVVAAVLAAAVSACVWMAWPIITARVPVRRGVGIAAVWFWAALALQVAEYVAWIPHRATLNYDASVAVGRLLPPGTIVQGKLANGLSLDNRIRPLFVGNGFGNYADRLQREDARYILTYDLPRLGYESSDGSGLIQGILDHYPQHRTIATLPVDETPEADRAVLIDKVPDSIPHARD